jgi:hypothetical protein
MLVDCGVLENDDETLWNESAYEISVTHLPSLPSSSTATAIPLMRILKAVTSLAVVLKSRDLLESSIPSAQVMRLFNMLSRVRTRLRTLLMHCYAEHYTRPRGAQSYE